MSTRLWHPFSDMAAVDGNEFVVDRAEGAYVYDEAGRAYLDGCASLWYCNVGHGRQEIVDAAMRQMSKLEAYSCFADIANRPALELAERLADLAPVDDAKVFFGSGGADAIDTAVKVARSYWQARGEHQRVHVVSRETGYHGTHGYGTSITGIPPNRDGWGVLAGENTVAPLHDLDGVEKVFAEVGPERIAAFVIEPVTGAGGVHLPTDGYVEGVAELCRRHGVLLVIDAVICGFGRLGTWFGIERFGVRPDMITFAKGVTSGYLPLGGLIVSGEVAAPWWTTPGERTLRHGPTYSGTPDLLRRRPRDPRRLRAREPHRARRRAGDAAVRGARAADVAPVRPRGARRLRLPGRGGAGAGRARRRPRRPERAAARRAEERRARARAGQGRRGVPAAHRERRGHRPARRGDPWGARLAAARGPGARGAGSVTAPNVFLADCPARAALDLIADTWSVVVLVGLAHGPRRYTFLLERAGGISKKMLTQTLRRLADAGLVARPGVRGGEYALTGLGESLLGPLTALTTWAEEHASELA